MTDPTSSNPTSSPIDPAKTRRVAEFKHDKPLTTCRVDPLGRYVFAGAEDLGVHRWELESGAKTLLSGHDSWVRAMDFSHDGQTLYTAGWDGQLRWWPAAADQPDSQRSVQAHQGFARWVRTSPCGRLLATCGNDLMVRVWDAETGIQLAEMAGHQRHPYAVDFHPLGEHLVSQDLMGQILVWDLATAKRLQVIDAGVMTGYDNKFAADMGGARDMRFRGDGDVLACAGITKVVNAFAGVQDPLIVLIDWQRKAITHHLRQATTAAGIAWGARFHRDGFVVGAVAMQSGKGELHFWRTEPLAPPLESLDEAAAPAPAPDKQAAPVDLKPFHTLPLGKCARAVDLTPDQRRLVVAHSDGVLRVYDMSLNDDNKE